MDGVEEFFFEAHGWSLIQSLIGMWDAVKLRMSAYQHLEAWDTQNSSKF